MIWIFSNVAFSAAEAPQVGEDDLLVFLNKAANVGHYLNHFRKVVYHRSPEEVYGAEVMGCVNRYVFSAGKASMPGGFIDELKRAYDWNYEIEAGKVKCMTTGYMVAMYMRNLYPDAEIALVNFGFGVKESTYRCPWHNWKFEDKALANFRHVYTSGGNVPLRNVAPASPGGLDRNARLHRKRVYYELSGWLGDNVYASAVVANLVAAGFAVNVSEAGHAGLWEPCRLLDRKISRENADAVIRQHYLPPWSVGCPHLIEGVTAAAAYDLNAEVPVRAKRPHIWVAPPKERLIDGRYVVINAGWQNSAPAKKWARERWEQLIALCPDVRFVQMGQKKNHAEPLAGAVDMIDRTDLSDLLRLVRDAACVVSPPSGVVHVAAAYKVPSILLAGGREPATLAAYPETHVFSACGGRLECCRDRGCHRNKFGTGPKECGCFRHGADGPTSQCMFDITAEEVAEALKKQLAKEKN